MQCVGRMESRDITAGMMDIAVYYVGLRPGCPVQWKNAEIHTGTSISFSSPARRSVPGQGCAEIL